MFVCNCTGSAVAVSAGRGARSNTESKSGMYELRTLSAGFFACRYYEAFFKLLVTEIRAVLPSQLSQSIALDPQQQSMLQYVAREAAKWVVTQAGAAGREAGAGALAVPQVRHCV